MRRNGVGVQHFTMVVVDIPRETDPAIPKQPWDKVLTEGHASLVRARRVFRYLPSVPRCKVCNNPFGGPAGGVFAAAGFSPSRKTPTCAVVVVMRFPRVAPRWTSRSCSQTFAAPRR